MRQYRGFAIHFFHPTAKEEHSHMSAQLINGKEVSQQRLAQVAEKVAARQAAGLRTPCLAVVLVGDDPASAVYVRNKEQDCAQCGISCADQRRLCAQQKAGLRKSGLQIALL